MKNWKNTMSLFLISQAITLFGSSIVQFAIIWYVTKETSSGFWVSMLSVSSYIPQFIISCFAGVWADRYSKKKLIICSDAGIAIATLLLAFCIPFITENKVLLVSLMVISAIRAVGAGIQIPAVSALIPEIAPQDKYMKVNGINSSIQAAVQFVAPAVAGVILSFMSFRTALFIDIATAVFGISLCSFILVPKTEKLKEDESRAGFIKDLVAGVKYAASEKNIGTVLIINGLLILLSVPAGFLASLFVTREFGDSYAYLTAIELVFFIGMSSGGIAMGSWGGFKNRKTTMVLGLGLFSILSTIIGFSTNFIVYLVIMGLYGTVLTMIQTASTTMLQEGSKPELQGRVFGLYGTMYSAFMPVGMAIFGPLADVYSLRAIMIITGILLILLTVFSMVRLKK